MTKPYIHPLIDEGMQPSRAPFTGGTLRCRCVADRVEAEIVGDVAHSHFCGCSKCWRPKGALFAVVSLVPYDCLTVTKHAEKLYVADKTAVLRRYVCRGCGVHMFADVVEPHAFAGLKFVHMDLCDRGGWSPPSFAAFVSTIIEQGYDPHGLDDLRARFADIGIEPYDVLSPPLMDAIATFTAKRAMRATGTAGVGMIEQVVGRPLSVPRRQLLMPFLQAENPRAIEPKTSEVSTSEVSDPVVVGIIAKAVEVFGSHEEAESWLFRPAIGLEQRRPIDVLETPTGVAKIYTYLDQIYYGVYV